MSARETIATALFEFSGSGQGVDDMLAEIALAQSDAILSALTATGYCILAPGEVGHLREREEAAREFVKRHPALSLIDLAEFEAFLKVPTAIRNLTDGGHDA